MAHDVVRRADDLVARKAADVHERRVRIGDAAVRIGRRHQCRVVGKLEFVLGDGLVVTHERSGYGICVL
ncbi:hypothetical protein X949_6306 [Burkholderia pseudomallei MSHR5609]|nr:hypothetical protein X948_6265 [Burkholderia pseudomallei MSHR5608]KGS27844.1 hypothetical protein X989_6278 [Burkholderia pseudomallei MSHR4378]KGS32816.1 hypothetical protein X962_6407 [Burkholderia pseudomallei MSHR7343]KGS59154.1 hypothetical protein X949_6306 [Burkholderia pseudomallei MSHR5609]KGS71413.1 hypothetical protein X990_6146 [Burkholderia pseudomallei MSHR4868]KGS86714.1 hypothetical protein X942_6690 [Burkholderia pseudomallei MSHR5596]KGS87174.1 hypothetical protein X947_